MTGSQYVIRVHEDPATVDAQAWDALLERQAHPTPFMRHAYLRAMTDSGSATAETGWAPRFLTLERDDRLVAACPLYLKSHSYGEYVFDWAWADAYRRHGLAYYPKLLCAVPFTPVPGSRLLAEDEPARQALARALIQLSERERLSSVHLLFPDEVDRQALDTAGWMQREGVQFHWTQDPAAPCGDFDTLLSRMQRDKRKKILQERRRVAEAGVRFEVHVGSQITEDLWDFFYDCYTRTYDAHRSTPYLTRAFFSQASSALQDAWVLFVALQGDERIGASLVATDRARGVAWGRYWGCTAYVPCLHFEACYYQPLAWCIEQGFERFEGGAQGEHKMARGLLPARTSSAHWLSHPRFAAAVADFLASESAGIERYVDELRDRSPFKDDPA